MEMQPTRHAMPPAKLPSILTAVAVVLIAFIVIMYVSVVNIGGSEVGIVEKKFGGGPLPQGRVIAANGENGIQAQVLMPGWHFFYWPWQYKIEKAPMIEIKSGYIGLVHAIDGLSLPPNTIYAPEWADPDRMIDAGYFLSEGKGHRGPQLSVLEPKTYPLNTKIFRVTPVPITNVEAGKVAVVKSNVGEIVDLKDRLVEVGQRGIWNKPWTEGQYYKNTNAYEITIFGIRQVKVSYSAKTELGEKAETQPMDPITVRSADGYTFPVEVRVIYIIEAEDAPRVVATIGDDDLVLTKLVTPTVEAIFRNNAGKVKALEYVQNRGEQEEQSAAMLKEKLAENGITILAVHIGDVGDEESLGSLLKTQTDREIALQEQATFQVQQQAAVQKQALAKALQEAEEEKRLATAAYAVKIADEEKKKVIIAAQAEAEQIKLIAEAKAEAYKLISGVIGPDNAALLEIMKLVATSQIRITPEVMVGTGGAGVTDALMGTMLKGMIGKEKAPTPK